MTPFITGQASGPNLPVTSGCFAPPTRPEFFGGGKTFGGAKHSASGSRGKKFSSPAARSERKKETKKGIRLSHFFGLAQVYKESAPPFRKAITKNAFLEKWKGGGKKAGGQNIRGGKTSRCYRYQMFHWTPPQTSKPFAPPETSLHQSCVGQAGVKRNCFLEIWI